MTIRFAKYQGTGNDFVMVDNRDLKFIPDNMTIARICDRRFGVGADGLILLEPAESQLFRMVYYNADGNESSMCGNGGRCIAHFARSLGLCEAMGAFEAVDGSHEFEIDPSGSVKLRMGDVSDIEVDGDTLILDTGSPHCVIPSRDIDVLDLVGEARAIRYNDRFSRQGINVNFVEVRQGRYFIRTYERGVEGETLSCGTGTVAVALSIAVKGQLEKGPLEINTPGGKLYVHFRRIDGGFSDIWLEGPAEMVFEGSIEC